MHANTTTEEKDQYEDADLPPTGGPCDLEHRGETADNVIKANDRHLKDAEKAGDETHRAAREAMKGRWRHPMRSMGWYRAVKQTFTDLPQD